MSQYGIFQAIFMSFYSRKLYKDIANNWGGKSFLYLFVILALSWIAFTYQTQIQFSRVYAEKSDGYINQIPVMNIKDGRIATSEKRPYLITDPDSHQTIAIIDTSGQYTTLEQAKTDFLITATKLISHPKTNETREYNVPASFTGTVEPQDINVKVKKFLGFLWIPMFFIFLLGSYLYRVIQALIYGVLGKLFGAIGGVSLAYSQIVQIAMVAITPVIVISTILDACHVVVPFQALAYFILAMVYLVYGIMSNKN
ncbi:MAG: DUF1189 family protein [Gammaproteobacteria bacterium]